MTLPALTLLAALGSGLIAGFFLAFSATVMWALERQPPPAGIAAMQAINVVVLNPIFLGVFFGTAILSLVLDIVALVRWSESGSGYLLAGSLLYFVGTFLVTLVFNVPLNNRLAAVEPDSAEGRTVWTHYLSAWTAWNHVRTVASLAAAACLILATAQQWG
ncbi:MAG TPA: anthrone oxygenase family protein [Methyloceanibacter sp.]|nr:anthrone oxygenase family protein [Methyloceanibacter sp.]